MTTPDQALTHALGAIVFATVRALPPERQQAYAQDLQTMLQAHQARGRDQSAALLTDLLDAAQLAAR